ncbi:sucrose operon repressor [[Actinobacillus] muris]|uniref:Sucrose operon repressor n=1 Tax=Muribacter muris TaxID=67855 RepID=A0A0J5P669_9PAST|nr:LacI family DNA-binding transcriptional regulator [Muribacter muris]KMK51878.1 sucrose operon repressor [[Actinobacillus] muris] [Muribacter muris]
MAENQPVKRITLNDIARLSGVSKTTASMVLNGQSEQFRIKPETRQRVCQIARQYGYRANAYAKGLKLQRTNVVGLIVPDLANYGFASTAKYLEKLCRDSGLLLVIACSDDNPVQEKLAIERLLDRQIDLIITAPTHQDPKYYKSVLKQTALLQLDRFVPQLDLCYAISDDTPKIAQLVQRVITTNHLSEYFYFGGQLSLSPSQSRLAGFCQGLAEGGLGEQPDWILHRDYRPESGYRLMQSLVERLGRLPQAVFTASYTILEGVLHYLTEYQQMDKLLNRQLQLATFDDHALLNALPFHIHSIKQDHEQIAKQVFTLIQQTLQGKALKPVKVPCEILWRG